MRLGAHATVLDMSPAALEQARVRFDALGLAVELVEADVFALLRELLAQVDGSIAFGLCAVQVPGLDYVAYDLLVPIVKP